jgi:hypothetical protein
VVKRVAGACFLLRSDPTMRAVVAVLESKQNILWQ